MLFDTKEPFTAGLGCSQSAALSGQDYFYRNLGASWFVTACLTLDARYIDVHLNELEEAVFHHDEFYPQALENKYLPSIILGF